MLNHSILIAKTEDKRAPSQSETGLPQEPSESEGFSISPSTIAFQALNFLVLLIILNKILYKPLLKLLKEREHKIKEGVENAEKADMMLQESQHIREDMIQGAQVESNSIIQKGRKAGDELKVRIIKNAEQEAAKKIEAGEKLIELKTKEGLDKLKVYAVDLVISATEKVIREKVDAAKDRKLIEESLKF